MLAIVAILIFVTIFLIRKALPIATTDPQNIIQPVSTSTNNQDTTNTQPPPVQTPKSAKSLNLPVPFTSQAPSGNWDEIHNQNCEEAAALMANAYLTGSTNTVLDKTLVEKELDELNKWENENFGYFLDTTAEETAQMITGYYGLKATVQNDYTFEDIKDQLNLHNVVILPVNGQLINNPNYKQPGPIYHMLVIRGFNSQGLITNDPGTRNGQNYSYSFQTLYDAAADWDHSANTIDQNKKVMIIVSK
jgi:hypothetical protein